MKKVLILVQAANVGSYAALRKAQQETWDSIPVEGVETVYYFGGPEEDIREISPSVFEYCSGTSDLLNMAHWKMKKAMDHFFKYEWDFVFRTNASSYCDKKLILEKAQSLPEQGCYCGINGGGYASGCGVFMSRDVMKIAVESMDESPNDYEDALMGALVGRQGITVTPGAERQDFGSVNDPIRNVYHYRCVIDKSDRTKDIQIFHRIHDSKRGA